jgi:hypothetical protein
MAETQYYEDIFDITDEELGMPQLPTLENVDLADIYKDLKIEDPAAYKEKFGAPTFTDEEIEALYAVPSYTGSKKAALAKFGFGLLKPTVGGRIGESLGQAGGQLAMDLEAVAQAQRKAATESQRGILTAQMQRQATEIANDKMIWDVNRGVDLQIAQGELKKRIDKNTILSDTYNKQYENFMKSKTDYLIKQKEPIKGQYRMPKADGSGYGAPFAGFEMMTDDGPLFFKPSSVIDEKTGLPKMELIKDPAGIQRMPTTMTGAPTEWEEVTGVSSILDLKSQIDTYDKNIMYLSDLRKSVGTNKMRAGFLAGLKMKGQDFAQIVSDAMGSSYDGMFGDGYEFADGTKIEKGTKYSPIHATVEAFLSQPEKVQQYLDEGLITEEDLADMKNLQGSFDQLSAVGEAARMADGFKGKAVQYGQKAMFDDGYHEIFESADEQNKIARKLGWYDTDLPLNQARANAIIYAIARARKSSGRLNLDDIQRAAQDLNLYGFTSSVAVITKLQFLEDDLRYARQATFNSFAVIPQFQPAYERMLELGYDTIDIERLRKSIDPGTQKEKAGTSGVSFTFELSPTGELTQVNN